MSRLPVSRSILFFLVLGSLAVLPAAAGTGFWTPLGPEGGQITALAVDPAIPDQVYVATQRGGVYKSANGGDTWGLLSHGIGTEVVVALAVSPQPFGPVYAVGQSGAVFRTVDGGGNWVRVWAGAPQPNGIIAPTHSLVIDARRPNILFAGTRQGLYRSADAGATWAPRGRSLGGAVRSLAYDAAGGWLYAGVDGQGVFRSFNQGNTWERISSGLPTGAFYVSLAFDPDRPRTLLVTTPQGLYRSLDRGGRWQRAGGLPEDNATAVAYQRHGRAYASFLAGMFHSSDSGATWRRSALLPGRNGGALRVLATGPDVVFAGLSGDPDGPGLYRSLDAGATFEPAVDGLQGLAVTSLAVDPSSAQTIYAAAGGNSLYQTTDGGATWSRVDLGLPGGGFYQITDILIDPARPATIWLAGGTAPPVLRSDDAGATWHPLGETGLAFRALALDPRAPDALWGAGWGGVYHSADGGDTWEHRDLGAAGSFLFEQVQVDPRDPAVVYVSGASVVGVRPPHYDAAVFRSADGGETWERRDTGILDGIVDFALDAADPATLYAVTGRLFRSTDAGLSWTATPGLPGFVYLTVATAPTAVYTAHQFPTPRVMRSTDRGATWTPLRNSLAPAIPHVLEVDPTNPAHLLLGTQNRSLLTYTVGGAAQ